MTEMKDKFKVYSRWYKKLDPSKQLIVLDFLNNKQPGLSNFTTEELNELSSMLKFLPKLIAEIADESKAILFFSKCGLDDLFSKSLYDFGSRNSKLYVTAKLIKKLNNDILQLIVVFIIEKMVLFEDYSEIPFNSFLRKTGLKKPTDLRSIISFLRHFIESVSSRKTSPNLLNELLQNDYGLNEEQSNIITGKISQKISELHQAFLMEQINEISLKLSNLSYTSEETEG